MSNKIIFRALCVFILISSALYAASPPARKKLFINSVSAGPGVPAGAAEKARDYISLAIFEYHGQSYQLVTDEDIRIMFRQAALMQATGCSDESCAVGIAQAVDADELIYGKINSSGALLELFMQNLSIDRNTGVAKKSMVSLKFAADSLEWHAREAAKKLIDPSYKIPVYAPDAAAERLKLREIEAVKTGPLNIEIMSFESRDRSIRAILDYLKELVNSGDVSFSRGDMKGAREQYRQAYSKITSSLGEDSRREITAFTEGINARISETFSREFLGRIQEADLLFMKQGAPDAAKLGEAEKAYRGIEKLMPMQDRRWFAPLHEALLERIGLIYAARASGRETEGDEFYAAYRFRESIDAYFAGIALLDDSAVASGAVKAVRGRLVKKIETARSTGSAWLANRVESYCSRAEYLNIRDEKENARSLLERAGWTIEANRIFSNRAIKERYERAGALLNFSGDEIKQGGDFYYGRAGYNYGTWALITGGLTLGFGGTGYYFHTLKEKADSGGDTGASDSNALKRNAFYSMGGVSLLFCTYFIYQYVYYSSVETKMMEHRASNFSVSPLYGLRNYGQTDNSALAAGGSGETFLGAVFLCRF